MVYILHIDSSANTAVIALSGDGELLASRQNIEARTHAAALNLLAGEVLAECSIGFPDLSAIAICGGPGSYTGLRIGMSAAKGWCYALDIPLLMHDRMLLLLLPYIYDKNHSENIYTAILPAREKEYFIASYDKTIKPISAPQHINEEELKITIGNYTKNAVLLFNDINIINNNNIYTSFINELNLISWSAYTYSAYNCNSYVKADYAEPIYLKQVYTHKSLKSS